MILIIILIIILLICVPVSILGLLIIIDTINEIIYNDEEVKDGKEN